MIAVVCGLLWLDWRLEQAGRVTGVPTAVVLVVLALGGFAELCRLARAAGAPLLPISGAAGTALLAVLPLADVLAWPVALGLVLLAIFVEQMARNRTEGAITHVGGTLLAAVYLGVGAALILTIRQVGIGTLVLFLAAVKFTDIGAYFTGKAIGRHKIIPWLSPGKSWEGLVGGLVAAGATALGVTAVLGLSARADTGSLLPSATSMPLWWAAACGVILGLAGQCADLCESLLKRTADLKDSAALVPEFGGVLDLIDSPWLAAPFGVLLLGSF